MRTSTPTSNQKSTMKRMMMWLVTVVLSLFINTNSLAGTTPVKEKAPKTSGKVVVKSKSKTTSKPTSKPKVATKPSKLDQMIEKVIPSLIHVESQGRNTVIGDKHLKQMAYGCLQIRQPCVDDVNRIYKTSHKALQMNGNRQLSIWVCKKYLKFWGGRLKEPGYEALARIWNGGPGWRKSVKTIAYWAKVKKVLKV